MVSSEYGSWKIHRLLLGIPGIPINTNSERSNSKHTHYFLSIHSDTLIQITDFRSFLTMLL